MNSSNENGRPCIYFAIGLMSGSSLDGLDIVYCTFQKKHISPDKWDHAIIFGETIPFEKTVIL
jgi:anhydro-N-acetylmuramic acid kinase